MRWRWDGRSWLRGQDGEVQRDAASEPWRFEDAAGVALPLQRGVTWIELLPAGGALELGSAEVWLGARTAASS